MIMLVSLISIARVISLFPRLFCMVHPIPTPSFIQLKDLCTCICQISSMEKMFYKGDHTVYYHLQHSKV